MKQFSLYLLWILGRPDLFVLLQGLSCSPQRAKKKMMALLEEWR
jgi:hypothetical protein